MNAKKKGLLRYLSMQRCFNTYSALQGFFSSMKVSDYSEELWYGDKKTAKEMQKEQLISKFHCSLTHLDADHSNLGGSGFKLKSYTKLKNPDWPSIMNFFATPSLNTVSFFNCAISKNDCELISSSIFENPIGACAVKSLNIGKNGIGKEGAKTLATAIEKNTSLINLDLSQCKLGVSGC